MKPETAAKIVEMFGDDAKTILGTWPIASLQRAFVDGAQWWQFHSQGSTMFPSERDEAESEAIARYGDPSVPK